MTVRDWITEEEFETAARKSLSRTLRDAGIYVEFNASDDTFDDSLIVWGHYRAPIKALERTEKKPKKRFMGEPKQKEKRPLPPELRTKLYTWITAGIVALILLTAGVISWNESNPGIFIGVSCMVAAGVATIIAIADE